MNTVSRFLLVAAATLVPLTVGAQTVYQHTNEQGVVEFSDQPSSSSSAVTVNPNVTEMEPTPEIETYQRPEKKQVATQLAPAPEVETEYTTVNNNNRVRRHVAREHNNPGGPVATPMPSHRPAVGAH